MAGVGLRRSGVRVLCDAAGAAEQERSMMQRIVAVIRKHVRYETEKLLTG